MPTEEQLIRQLRVLYGIAPDSPPTTENTSVNSAALSQFQAERDNARAQMDRHPGNQYWLHQWIEARDRYDSVNGTANTALQQQPQDPSVAEAAKNRGLLDSIFGGIRKSTLDDGTRELNTRFTDTLRSQNSALAARGLTGGSADRSRQGRTLSDLLLGRQRLAGAADAADQSSRQSLDEQRQQTERQIKLGTQPDVSTINAMQQAQTGLNQAYRGLTEQALGGLLTQGANTYRDVNQADAYGRRGWGAVAPSSGRGGSSGGSFYP